MASSKNLSSIKDIFPPIPTEQWLEVINQDLKGADFSKKLIWRPTENIEVQPFYRAEDLEGLPTIVGLKPNGNDWLVREDIDAENPVAANSQAKAALSRGCESIGFILPANSKPGTEYFTLLLEGIDPTGVEINILAQGFACEVLESYYAYLRLMGVSLYSLNGSVLCSPLDRISSKGKFCKDKETAQSTMSRLAKQASESPNLRLFGVGGNIFHNAGASAVQELAFSIAMGAEYLDWLTSEGVDPSRASGCIKFTQAVGTNYFMEIAKLRAARHLWAKIQEAYGVKPEEISPICIHAVTGTWGMTLYDPYVNMLRTTTGAMSAVLGGTHSLTVLPFDSTFHESSPLSQRVARNQQLVLREEAYLNRVADPAAGSYFIENLTASLAQNAWALFLEVEEQGGYTQSFAKGFIQKQIADTASKRLTGVSSRRETIVGINQYPNAQEQAPSLDTIVGSTSPDRMNSKDEIDFEPLPTIRAAQSIEALRLATDRSGLRPKVFMLTLGNLAMRRARAQFACNFFACAGFEVIDSIGFASTEEGVKAAIEAQAQVVVLCSSDDEYLDLAPKVYSCLPSNIMLAIAGNPQCREELERMGVERFIHVKSNLLETLSEYQGWLGV